MSALLHDTDIALAFDATQEARHQCMLRANEIAKALVERSKAAAVGRPADEDGVVPGPQRLRIVLGYAHDDITIKQRGFLHAAVFPQIAEKYVFPDGTRYSAKAWKEFWRARFLGDRWEMRRAIKWDAKAGCMVQAKRATPHRIRVSTEDLSIRQYSAYIDRVIDTATVELGITFEFDQQEREAVRYKRPARKAKQAVPA
jgi:hypothetical protein